MKPFVSLFIGIIMASFYCALVGATENDTTNTTKALSENSMSTNGTMFDLAVRSGNKRKKQYHISSHQAGWHAAVLECRKKDMGIASIDSKEEQEQLKAAIIKAAIGKNSVWVGGNNFANKKTFMWISTGTKLVYTNWRPAEPDNRNWGGQKGEENCVEVVPAHNYKWNDFTCYAKLYFACQT